MKALADDDPHYPELRDGRWHQGMLAKKLHREVGVPEGPCGLQEIKQIQQKMGPTYLIKVFEGQQGLLWYKDPAFDGTPKKICLLKMENHFHGLRSVPALLNRSFYCDYCEKGYNTEDFSRHNCFGQNCKSCRRTNKTCPNLHLKMTPEVYCRDCNRCFYGQNCFQAHKQSKKSKSGLERPSVCSQVKKCGECCKEYRVHKKKKHVCYQYTCPNCKEEKDINNRCYIQPYEEQEKKSGLRIIGENEEEYGEEEEETAPAKVEPLKCVIDFECGTDENKNFEEYCVGWRYVGVEESYRQAGTSRQLLDDVMSKTVTEDGKERKVFVFAHNMRGFDSSFLFYGTV